MVAAPQTFCLVTGIITAWLIFIFLFDKNYLVFKKKRAFEHPSCDDTGHSLAGSDLDRSGESSGDSKSTPASASDRKFK